jgi:hypothetical protein
VLEQVELRTLRSQGYVFNIELTFRALGAGFQVTEVPIVFHDRAVGESKISLAIAVEALWLVPVLRFPVLARWWPARKAPTDGHNPGPVREAPPPQPREAVLGEKVGRPGGLDQ